MKTYPLLIYGAGTLMDVLSTYAALLLVPGAVETNPRVAPLLFTPFHFFAELAAFTAMFFLYLVGLLVEEYDREKGFPRLGVAARRIVHAAVAAVGILRMLAATNNILLIVCFSNI
ncbi:MAG: hypothetical protein QXT28_08635 [Thermofilaceae archaeon]